MLMGCMQLAEQLSRVLNSTAGLLAGASAHPLSNHLLLVVMRLDRCVGRTQNLRMSPTWFCLCCVCLRQAWVNTPRAKGGLGGCSYPLLADLTKQVARDYEVLIEEGGDAGVALR
jgi:hypothetical protein